MVPRLRKPVPRPKEHINLTKHFSKINGDVLVASDAGAKDGATSIGIAAGPIDDPENKRAIYKENRSVGSIDTTPFLGELEGAARVMKAAKAANKQVQLIVDNKAVVDIVNRLKTNSLKLPKYCWAQIIESEEAILANTRKIIWCPSHNKRLEWEPRNTHLSKTIVRSFNDMADKQATKGLNTDRAARQLNRQNAIEKLNGLWTVEMFARQKAGCFAFMHSHHWEEELEWFQPRPAYNVQPPVGGTVGC